MFGICLLTFVCFCVAMGEELNSLQRHFEFEDILTPNQTLWMWRGQASGNKTLYLIDQNQQYLIQFQLCIFPLVKTDDVKVALDDIRYSNNGPSDAVTVTLDDQHLGDFNTTGTTRQGHEWNVFMNSKQIGEAVILKHGIHTLSIEVKTDEWGVEFDKIRITAENQDPTKDLICGGTFTDKLGQPNVNQS